jgi:hypothetical protein
MPFFSNVDLAVESSRIPFKAAEQFPRLRIQTCGHCNRFRVLRLGMAGRVGGTALVL